MCADSPPLSRGQVRRGRVIVPLLLGRGQVSGPGGDEVMLAAHRCGAGITLRLAKPSSSPSFPSLFPSPSL